MFSKFFGNDDKKKKLLSEQIYNNMETLELCQALCPGAHVTSKKVKHYFEGHEQPQKALDTMQSLQKEKRKFKTWSSLCKHVNQDLGLSHPAVEESLPPEEPTMSFEELTTLYPDVSKVLAYMSNNPDMFKKDEIAVTVRSLYNLVRLADSTHDVLKFLKRFVKQEKRFDSFDELTEDIRIAAEKLRVKQQKEKEKKKQKKKQKKQKLHELDHPGTNAYNAQSSSSTSGAVTSDEKQMEAKKMEEMRKAMAKMSGGSSPHKLHPHAQKRSFQVLPQINSSGPNSLDRRSIGGKLKTFP